MARPRIQIDTSEFETMYNDYGVKLTLIADHFNVSVAKIRKTRDSLNLPKRLNAVIVDENEFLRLFDARVTYNEMAKILGMSWCSVIAIKQRLGLPNRNNLFAKVQNDR